MKWSRSVLRACFALCVVLAPGAHAIEEQRFGDVPFLTGGIGEWEREVVEQLASAYNLKVLTAAKRGNFLSDAEVTVLRGEKTVLRVQMQGPYLLAVLDPGDYTISATYRGQRLERRITIPAQGRRDVHLLWDWRDDAP